MTVIAWDGKTLAADKMVSDGWCVFGSTTKIHSTPKGLVGLCGSASASSEVLAWFLGDADPAKYPEVARNSGTGAQLLHIFDNGHQIHIYDVGPYPIEISRGQYAIGSGREAAMAVMMLGHEASTAVEIASRISKGCGNGVDVLEFNA